MNWPSMLAKFDFLVAEHEMAVARHTAAHVLVGSTCDATCQLARLVEMMRATNEHLLEQMFGLLDRQEV